MADAQLERLLGKPLIDFTGDGVVDAPPDAVRQVVADLTTYPAWLGVVAAVVPDGDGWLVDIGARLGPLRRTKRVRMARAADDALRFERQEDDGRAHSPWVLAGTVAPEGRAGTRLTMHLYYGGGLWAPGLDRVLRDEVRRALPRLERLASGRFT